MIDPRDIINYHRTKAELEEHYLFCLVVAGKTAATQATLLNKFLNSLPIASSPFEQIKLSLNEETFDFFLKESKLGQYNRLTKAIQQSLHLNLKTCSVADLEKIHGIGPKTARMFIMQNRPNQRLAALDTHVLKYLKAHDFDVPKTTPSGKTYIELENIFLTLADKAKKSPAEFDLEIWRSYQKY